MRPKRVVVLEYPIQKISDYDDEEYEQVGLLNRVRRETQNAVLINVVQWEMEAWFPRSRLRIDEDEVIWCERRFYHQKERERV